MKSEWTSLRSTGGAIGVLSLVVAGCGAPTGAEGDDVGAVEAPLYAKSTLFWPSREIEVCWTDPGFATEKGWVRHAVLNSWGAESGLMFYGWRDCPANLGNFSGIRVTPSTTQSTQTFMPVDGPLGPGNTPLMIIDVTAHVTTGHYRCSVNNLNRENCIRSIALHEFGHAIGFLHEQQRPDADPACPLSGYRTGGGDYTFGTYDFNSIMRYCNYPPWPSNKDYGGLVDIYGPELGAPIMQRTSNSCVVPAAFDTENALATFSSGCIGEDGRASSPMELTQTGLLRSAYNGMCLVPEGGVWPQSGTRLVFTSACSPVPLLGMFFLKPSGSFQHFMSGMCVHPSGGSATPAPGTPLVLHTGCDESRLQFKSSFVGPARIGHSAGLCVHPWGGSVNPPDGTAAVLWNDCTSIGRTDFVMRSSGSIQHVSSGKCLHPNGGSINPPNGTGVVFWGTCDEPRLAFELTARGSLRHVASGKCLHPNGGSSDPAVGTQLVFHDGCNEDRMRFGAVFW